MKVEMDRILLDFEGKQVMWPVVRNSEGKIIEPEKPLTMRKACIEALNGQPAGDQADGEERLKRFRIALKIATGGPEVSLAAEEIVKIKELVGKGFVPVIVGRVHELLTEKETA